jgi:hypothetical protein
MSLDEPTATPSSSEPAVPAKKSRKRKTRLLIIAAVIITILLGILYVVGARYVMKDVMYDNGLGGKYKMKFYAKHETKNISGDTGGTEGEKLSTLQGIFAKYGREGKAPLGMTISDTPVEADAATYQSLENCKELPVAMTVHNEYAGKDLKICVLRSDGKDVMYLAVLKDGGTVHNVTFLQDVKVDSGTASSGNQKTDNLQKSIGLKVYRSDIKDIMSSLRPAK